MCFPLLWSVTGRPPAHESSFSGSVGLDIISTSWFQLHPQAWIPPSLTQAPGDWPATCLRVLGRWIFILAIEPINSEVNQSLPWLGIPSQPTGHTSQTVSFGPQVPEIKVLGNEDMCENPPFHPVFLADWSTVLKMSKTKPLGDLINDFLLSSG